MVLNPLGSLTGSTMSDLKKSLLLRRGITRATSNDCNSSDTALTAKTSTPLNNSDQKPLTLTPNRKDVVSNDTDKNGWSFFSLLSCWLGGNKKNVEPVLAAAETTVPLKEKSSDDEEKDENEHRRRIGEVPKPAELQQCDTDNDAPDMKSLDKRKASNECFADAIGSTLISVNPEDSDMPEFIAPELLEETNCSSPINIRELFDCEVVSSVTTEMATKPRYQFSQVSFARSQTVYTLPSTRQRLHKKIIRSRHDPWRRHGALIMIHQLGGWSYTIQGNDKVYTKIAKGTRLPPPPMIPPIMTEEEFHKRAIITMPASNKDAKSQRQRNHGDKLKKIKNADSDTIVSDEDPPSC